MGRREKSVSVGKKISEPAKDNELSTGALGCGPEKILRKRSFRGGEKDPDCFLSLFYL